MKKPIIYIISTIFILISTFLILKIFNPSFLNIQDSIPNTDSSDSQTQTQDMDSHQPDYQESKPETNPINTPRSTSIIKPTPTPDPQTYACGAGGVCNSYLDPESAGCPITFKDEYCENRCDDPSVRCSF